MPRRIKKLYKKQVGMENKLVKEIQSLRKYDSKGIKETDTKRRQQIERLEQELYALRSNPIY